MTVTNPDGQSRSGARLIAILAPGAGCDDGDPTTCQDQCADGTCLGHNVAEPVEIGPTVRFSRSYPDSTFEWSDELGTFRAYRGSKHADSAWSYDQVCLATMTNTSKVTDTANPQAGDSYYYLVSRANLCRESVLGRDGAGKPIPNAAPCTGAAAEASPPR